MLLVRLIDGLLDLMEEDGAFRYFQMDGQTCIMEDYLEIRPENRDRLAALIREGRILIGPWYTMPDLFCPDDESLVRNLLLGRRISSEWGVEPMPVGFICDMFGHPSQMPQIFRGFGIRDIVMGRGTNEFDTPMFFEWESPDGSRALTYKLQDRSGYGAFALPRAIMEGTDGEAAGQVPDRDAYLAELATAGDCLEKREAVKERWGTLILADYIRHETGRANVPVVAVMDTMDHVPPAEDVAKYLRLIREGCPEVVPEHSTLPAFFEAVRRAACEPLPVRNGELRDPSRDKCGYLYLIPNCVSSRIRLKQANDAAAGLLEQWAEPMLAFMQMVVPGRCAEFLPYLRVAWKQVLGNHAHDSICGCSIDQVHRDMMGRFDQASVIGRQLREQALAALTADCVDLAEEKDDFTLTLVNPLPHRREGISVFDIDLPVDYPATMHEGFRTQDLKAFTLEDAEGTPVAFQRLAFRPVLNERSKLAKYCFISNGPFTRYTVAAEVSLPACGFTSLRVKPSKMPVRTVGSLRTGPVSAENEFLRVGIEGNGTLTLTDKTSGAVYRDLLTFEDRSEIGDGWFHGHSLNDSRVLSSASPAQVEVVHDGPLQVSFRVRLRLSLPARYDWHEQAPSVERRELSISSEITLKKGARALAVTTVVENNVEDHQLQLLLPTDAVADTYLAHTGFDIVRRPIALDARTVGWQEMDIVEKPFQSVQAVAGKGQGLAFLSGGGLHEGGVRDDARRTMQVTLLRSFRRTVGTEGEQDGLEQGRIAFSYGLMPFSGAFPAAVALREATVLQTGVITRQTGKRPSGHAPMRIVPGDALAGDSPAERAIPVGKSFLEQEGEVLVLSAIKPSEEGNAVVVRLWNPTEETQCDRLRLGQAVSTVRYADLREIPMDGVPAPKVAGEQISVCVEPHQIVTLRLDLSDSF